MSGPWMTVYFAVVAVTLLACGFLAGWLARGDHNASRELDQVEAGLVALAHGRHAASHPRRFPVTTGELAALYGREYPAKGTINAQ